MDNFTGGCRFSLVVQSIAEGRERGKKGGSRRKKEGTKRSCDMAPGVKAFSAPT